jgi:hypothetical protein
MAPFSPTNPGIERPRSYDSQNYIWNIRAVHTPPRRCIAVQLFAIPKGGWSICAWDGDGDKVAAHWLC